MHPDLTERWNQLPSRMTAEDRRKWIRSQELLRQGHPGTIGPETDRSKGTLPPPIDPGATVPPVPSPTPAGAAANRDRLIREYRARLAGGAAPTGN